MNYRDYKRHVKLAEVLNKPLEGDFLVIDNYVKYLRSLKRQYHHHDYRMDISFTDIHNGSVIIEIRKYNVVVSDTNLPTYLFKNVDEIEFFLSEFINSELVYLKGVRRWLLVNSIIPKAHGI